MPSLPVQQFPLKNGALSLPLHQVCGSHCSGHGKGGNSHGVLINCSSFQTLKMEIGLIEDKQLLKKKNILSKMLLTEAHIKQEVNIDRSGNIVTTDSQQLYFS